MHYGGVQAGKNASSQLFAGLPAVPPQRLISISEGDYKQQQQKVEYERRRYVRNHPAPLSDVALCRESTPCLRTEGHFVALGAYTEHHAEAGIDAAHGRLSPHAGNAGRRRYFLRHALHPARGRTAFSRAEPISERR